MARLVKGEKLVYRKEEICELAEFVGYPTEDSFARELGLVNPIIIKLLTGINAYGRKKGQTLVVEMTSCSKQKEN